VSRKALGRGLGDLLHHARPARAISRAAASEPQDLGPADSEPLAASPAPTPEGQPDPAPAAALPVSHAAPLVSSPPGQAPDPASSTSERPLLVSRLQRFGPSYTPPPQPAGPPGRGGLYLVLVVDVLLILFAAAMAFGPWVQRPFAFYLAAAAVLVGGTLACGAIAYQATPHRPPSGSPKPSRVRVRLTRL